MKYSCFAIILSLLGLTIAQPVLTGFNQMVNFTDTHITPTLDDTRIFEFYYSIEATGIRIGVVAEVPIGGWAAFGLSPTGAMSQPDNPSDAWLMWVNGMGTPMIADMFLSGRTAPSTLFCGIANFPSVCPDVSQSVSGIPCQEDLTLISGMRLPGNVGTEFLSFVFSRSLVAPDAGCDRPIALDMDQFVIFATGPTSGTAFPFNALQHTYRTFPPSQVLNFNSTLPSGGMVTTMTVEQAPNCAEDFATLCTEACMGSEISSCTCLSDGNVDAQCSSASQMIASFGLFFSLLFTLVF